VRTRERFGQVVAAPGGGFFLETGASKTIRDEQGREIVMYITYIDRVDVDFRRTWRYELPLGLWVSAMASDRRGGVVATVGSSKALRHQQITFDERGIGLIGIDSGGQWRFGRRIERGGAGYPRHLAVEPGQTNRIAVLMRDIIERLPPRPGHIQEIWGPKIRVYDFDGRPQGEFTRRWNNADGLIWTAPGKLLIFADGGGQIDRQRRLLPVPEANPDETERRGDVETMKLVDADSGQAYWSRQWLTSSAWDAFPTLGAEGSLAFITYSTEDPRRPEERGRIATQDPRLVVVDAATGELRWSRPLDNPRACRGTRHVLADPRNGDWIVIQPRACAGHDQLPTALLIERLTHDGGPRWTEFVGSLSGGAPRHVETDRDWPRISVDDAAVATS